MPALLPLPLLLPLPPRQLPSLGSCLAARRARRQTYLAACHSTVHPRRRQRRHRPLISSEASASARRLPPPLHLRPLLTSLVALVSLRHLCLHQHLHLRRHLRLHLRPRLISSAVCRCHRRRPPLLPSPPRRRQTSLVA
jgi:hypothetical protein